MAGAQNITPTKFTFGTSFNEPGGERGTRDRQAVQDAVEVARGEGFASGHAAGMDEAHASIDAATLALLRTLEATIATHQAAAVANLAAQKADIARVAHAIATRLSASLMTNRPLAEIEALVADCMANCPNEPRLLVRIADELVEPLKARLDALKVAGGFLGQIILLGDQDIRPGDCRIEWPDGGVERNMDAVLNGVDAAVQRFLMS